MKFYILVPLLTIVLLFQSMWNIAAAFCKHEESLHDDSAMIHHFGHHKAQHPYLVQYELDSQGDIILQAIDHQNHLKTGVVLLEYDVYDWVTPLRTSFFMIQPNIGYPNLLYQSPDLLLIPPPPEHHHKTI